MENIIYCFSGTGNSLATAREIAKQIGNTKVELIADLMQEDKIDLAYERVGIVCPAYFSSLPPIIEEFVKKLDFHKAKYVYAVITAGALQGSSFDRLNAVIREQGGHLDGSYPLQMPDNYIAMYGAWPKPLQKYLLKKAKRKTAKISQSVIVMKHTGTDAKKEKQLKSLTEKMGDYQNLALDYKVSDQCIGCETCAKVCPTKNITMVNKRPVFGADCARCMACIQWCGAKAIDYKDKTTSKKRYTHPEIKATDLYRKQS